MVVTKAAKDGFNAMRRNTSDPDSYNLRLQVDGKECCKYSYTLIMDNNPSEEDDVIFHAGEFDVFIDKYSHQYVEEATIDWAGGSNGYESFKVINPLDKPFCTCDYANGRCCE